MKKKKWLIIIIAIAIIAAVVAGNSSSDDSDGKKTVTGAESSGSKKVSIEKQVLLDQNGIVVTAEEYVTDSIWGDGIKLLLENNTDKNVGISCKALMVNDYMIGDLFSETVAPGKKSNETMYFLSSELEAAGIDTIGKIEVEFHIFDGDSYEGIFDTDCVTIKTSAFDNMDTTANDLGNELYNEGGIRIVGKTVDENSFWGAAILLYCENTSGRNITIQVDNVSINGFMIQPLFSATVYNNKKCIDDITLLSSELEENGIESIDKVELVFKILDSETFETIAESNTITFSAK